MFTHYVPNDFVILYNKLMVILGQEQTMTPKNIFKKCIVRHNTRVPTFDNTDEFFHVVMCFAIVNHCGNREDQLWLYLREPVKNTLQQKREKYMKERNE